MFTGLIAEVGILKDIRRSRSGLRLRIGCKKVHNGQGLGDSIAVQGVCLTVVALHADGFSADAVGDTLAKTSIPRWKPGIRLNLEAALRVGQAFGGHIVQGHVQAIGNITRIEKIDGAVMVTVAVPEFLQTDHSLVAEGSVAVDGISLTVAECGSGFFRISIIPHTLAHTTLSTAQKGDRVNIETDAMLRTGRQTEKVPGPAPRIGIEALKAWGY